MFDGESVEIEFPVRFAETDAMGVVHHSNYPIWFEASRVAWMDAVGFPYTEFAAGGHHFAVTGLNVQFRTAARFGDVVRVKATLQSVRSRQVVFAYRVENTANGALLAMGETEHICVDLQGRMAKIPQRLLDRLGAVVEGAGGSVELQR